MSLVAREIIQIQCMHDQVDARPLHEPKIAKTNRKIANKAVMSSHPGVICSKSEQLVQAIHCCVSSMAVILMYGINGFFLRMLLSSP